MAIRISIYDEANDTTTDSRLEDGDFTIIATKPCTVEGIKILDEGHALIKVANFKTLRKEVFDATR